MGYRYEAGIKLADGIGHVGASAVRDGVEDALKGAMEPGEEAYASLDSDSAITLVIKTEREIGDTEASALITAVRDVLSASADPGETFSVDELSLQEWPGMTPGR